MIDQMWYKYDITGCLNVFKNRFFCNHLFILRFSKEDFDIKLELVNVDKNGAFAFQDVAFVYVNFRKRYVHQILAYSK